MSDESTSPKAGSFDVRTALLNIIGSRKEGVSQQELMRKMRELATWRTPFYYEVPLTKLVEEGHVAISHCGMANHKTRVYLLAINDLSEKTCRVCKLTKPVVTFRRRSDSKDGYTHQCKLCENQQRKDRGSANKARNRRREELKKEGGLGVYASAQPRVILDQEEVDAAAAAVKAESLKEYQRKNAGKVRYVVVDGKVLPASGHERSPVEEYDRAWRRIQAR